MNDDTYPTPFNVWADASSRVFTSILEANQAANKAAFSMLGAASMNGVDNEADTGTSVAEEQMTGGLDLPEWDIERNVGATPDVGDSVRFAKTISQRDIERFAAASGDTNLIHLNEAWAKKTRFNGRIVHGILVTGLISAALARLPGSIVYLSQDLEFRAPVRIDDYVTATVELVEDLGGDQYRLRTTVTKDDDQVIDGEAVVLIDEEPAET